MKSSDSTNRATVVCLSGGMDSTSLLLHLLAREDRVYGLSFNYAQRHVVELEFLQHNLELLALLPKILLLLLYG